MINLHERMLPDLQPPDHQSDTHWTEPPRPALGCESIKWWHSYSYNLFFILLTINKMLPLSASQILGLKMNHINPLTNWDITIHKTHDITPTNHIPQEIHINIKCMQEHLPRDNTKIISLTIQITKPFPYLQVRLESGHFVLHIAPALIVLGFNVNLCGSFCVISQKKGEER